MVSQAELAAVRRRLSELERDLAALDTELTSDIADLAGITDAWTSYTPQIDQGASTDIAKTVDYAKYQQIGKTVVANVAVSLTAAGTAGSDVTMSLPVGPASNTYLHIGSAHIYDSSTGTFYSASALLLPSDLIAFGGDWSGAAGWGTTPNIALASGDVIRFSVIYEVA